MTIEEKIAFLETANHGDGSKNSTVIYQKDKEQQELSKELHIPIQTLLKDETLDLIMKNLPDLIS